MIYVCNLIIYMKQRGFQAEICKGNKISFSSNKKLWGTVASLCISTDILDPLNQTRHLNVFCIAHVNHFFVWVCVAGQCVLHLPHSIRRSYSLPLLHLGHSRISLCLRLDSLGCAASPEPPDRTERLPHAVYGLSPDPERGRYEILIQDCTIPAF